MKPAMFKDMTNVLGAPKDWDEKRDGTCGGLPVNAERKDDYIVFTSCWTLEPGELELLRDGGRIYLRVLSTSHPPVDINVRKEQ